MSRRTNSIYIVLVLVIVCTVSTYGQSRFIRRVGVSKIPEHGLVVQAGAGIAAIKSDICGSWGCNDIGPAMGIGALYKLSPYVAISSEVEYVKLGAVEKDPTRKLNIAFESEVIEVSAMLMLNLLDSYSGSGNYRSSRKRFVVPYVKAGAGFVYYTPTSYPADQGKLNESQTTYDRERNYPALAPVIPFGGGLRFRFSDYISVAPELMYHITTTDYLDNVGPRIGNPSTYDHYGVAAIKLMYTPIPKNEIFTKKHQGIK